MKFILSLAFVLVGLVRAADDAEDFYDSAKSRVINLTEANFEESMKSGKPWLIKIYAPWCGHCKRLAPVWSELADDLKGEVNVAAIDATVETTLARRFRISGYPSLFFTNDGGAMFARFQGRRDLETLKDFAMGGHEQISSEERIRLASGAYFEMLQEDII